MNSGETNLLPCLTLPAEKEQPIGIWGQRIYGI